MKNMLALFVLFLWVASDVFVDSVVASFSGGVSCRTPTPYGVVIQGVFLVIFYAAASHLIRQGAI